MMDKERKEIRMSHQEESSNIEIIKGTKGKF